MDGKIKYYDFPIIYHPEKVNVVADALSTKLINVANLQGIYNFSSLKTLELNFNR